MKPVAKYTAEKHFWSSQVQNRLRSMDLLTNDYSRYNTISLIIQSL